MKKAHYINGAKKQNENSSSLIDFEGEPAKAKTGVEEATKKFDDMFSFEEIKKP